jgi:hypothetical protein
VAKQEDAMTKTRTKRQGKPARKAKAKPHRKPTQTAVQNPDCPYRVGTLYATTFLEANKDYILKSELIKKVAEMTGKSEKVVNFAYQVLKSPKHRSNKGRSTVIEENGKIKLIPIRNNH